MGSFTAAVLLRIFCLLGSIKIIYSGSDNFHFDIGWEKPMPQGYIMPESSNPKLRRIAKAYEDSADKLPKEPIPIFEPNPPMKKVQFGFGIDGLLSWVKKSNSSSGSGSSSSNGDDCDEDEELNRIITWKLIARQMGDDLMAEKMNDILKDALKNGLCSGSSSPDYVSEHSMLKDPTGEKPEGPPPKVNEDDFLVAPIIKNFISDAEALEKHTKKIATTTQATLNDQPVGMDSYKQPASRTAAVRKTRTNGKRVRKTQSKKKKRNEKMEMLMDMYMSNKSARKRKKAARSIKKRKSVGKNRQKTNDQKQSTGQLLNG